MTKHMTVDRLTDQSVKKLPFTARGQSFIRERHQCGFGVVVGRKSKSYAVQVQTKVGNKWKSSRRTIAKTDQMNVKQARRLAKDIADAVRQAATAPAAAPESMTLLESWESYERALVKRGRAQRTIDGYRAHVETHLQKLQERSMKSLADNPAEIAKLHEKLTVGRGAYAANGTMRTLSAVANHAAKYEPELKDKNPVRLVEKNREKRRQTALSGNELPAWKMQLDALNNPVRRSFHLLSLFTGSRPDALKRAKWSDLDLKLRIWNFPKPKGGEGRSFDIPLSKPLLREIAELRRAGLIYGNSPYMFPADGRDGHIVSTRERRTVLSKWGNDLRQTFRTSGVLAGVDEISMHILMNHKLRGVNAGYINLAPLWPALTAHQTNIIKHFQKAMEE